MKQKQAKGPAELRLKPTLLFCALTVAVFIVFDCEFIDTPISPINHWIPEYILITLLNYACLKARENTLLLFNFITMITYSSAVFASASDFSGLFFTLAVFLSTFPVAHILTKIRRTR
jgi:membrane-associated HD superfamily phosphohydrolase